LAYTIPPTQIPTIEKKIRLQSLRIFIFTTFLVVVFVLLRDRGYTDRRMGIYIRTSNPKIMLPRSHHNNMLGTYNNL
jgi:hypothetical protein